MSARSAVRRAHAPLLAAGVLFGRSERPRRWKLRILGEDLGRVFRGRQRRSRLTELHHPHRGTSLELGLVGEKGIRCCYHGWLFGCDVMILDAPGRAGDYHPEGDQLFHGAYPVQAHGLCSPIWGRPGGNAGLPDFMTAWCGQAIADRPWAEIHPPGGNYLQILENTMDAIHTSFLLPIVSGAAVHRRIRRAARAGVHGDAGRHHLHRHRRVGDNIWSARSKTCCRNPQEVAPVWETGRGKISFSAR